MTADCDCENERQPHRKKGEQERMITHPNESGSLTPCLLQCASTKGPREMKQHEDEKIIVARVFRLG